MQLPIKHLTTALVLAAALVTPSAVGAAVPGAASASASRSPNGCSVLTSSDVHAASGLQVTREKVSAQGPFSTCSYTAGGRTFYFLIADQAAVKARSAFNTTAAYWKNTVRSSGGKQ
jgi:hypothetical protein